MADAGAGLVVLVPSRGRPQAVAEMREAFQKTCTRADTRLVFVVDENDPDRFDYSSAVSGAWDGPAVSVGITRNDAGTMVGALNEAAIYLATQEDGFRPFAIGFMGDDHRPRTEGWDEAYVNALAELGTGLVYAADGLQDERLPTQVAMTTDIVQALGFMAPPFLRHLYVDNFWLDVGRGAGRLAYLGDVLIEHMHPAANKAEPDEGYMRVNAPEGYATDSEAYSTFKDSPYGLRAAVRRVLDAAERSSAGDSTGVHEWRLFEEGTIPEYTTAEWYQGREHAPHLEQEYHRDRLFTTATFVGQAIMHMKIRDRPTRVSDLGAGDGGLLSLLGPAVEAWGYDLMPDNLEHKRNVDVRLADVLNDDIEYGDVVVCTEMLEHLVDPHGFVAALAARPEVRALVCSSPADERPGRSYEFHTWAWDMDGYAAMLRAGGWNVKRQKYVNGFQVMLALKPDVKPQLDDDHEVINTEAAHG